MSCSSSRNSELYLPVYLLLCQSTGETTKIGRHDCGNSYLGYVNKQNRLMQRSRTLTIDTNTVTDGITAH
jgi:hypothetical protein